MIALLAAVFVASLLGSLHCAGMCGGVVALCIGVADEDGAAAGRINLHIAYNGGRLLTYGALGAAAGALGAALDAGGSAILGTQRIAAVVAGGLMVLAGVVALLRICGVAAGRVKLPPSVKSTLNRMYGFAFGLSPVKRALLIGLLTGLLPCGWLWAFVFAAAGTGSAVVGGLTMAVFWAGTIPVIVAVGTGLQAVTGRVRRYFPLATSVLLILVGLVTVAGRLQAPAMASPTTAFALSDPTHSSTSADALTRVNAIDQSELSCCHDARDDTD